MGHAGGTVAAGEGGRINMPEFYFFLDNLRDIYV